MVVRELLSGGSSLGRSCARSGKVGEFVGSLCVLVFDVLSNWAVGHALGDGMVLDSINGGRGVVDSSILCILQARRARACGRVLDGRSYRFVRHDCGIGME